MTLTLRPMRWWDVEAALPLEEELFGAEAWSAETWWAELAAPGRHYLVGLDGDALVGYAGLFVNGSDADVMTIAVSSAAQGHGHGGALMGALLDLAAERGAQQVLLEVRADNVPAQRLYERHGFKRIAVRRGYYRTAEGSVDAWVMRRRDAA
ncbi:MAG: ribosomal protein S18-alanine N-acetyltransferase [Angustibacter sp.]